MRINFEIKYKGKKYSTLSNAFEDAIKDRINEVLKRIEPFENEIKKHNGKITVNASGNPIKITIGETGLPKELSEEIKKALK